MRPQAQRPWCSCTTCAMVNRALIVIYQQFVVRWFRGDGDVDGGDDVVDDAAASSGDGGGVRRLSAAHRGPVLVARDGQLVARGVSAVQRLL